MSSPVKGKGRFINSVWHCNCNPRLPASHFQVKKDSANKGRWFYTCSAEQGSQCGFFLWDEDAKVREEQVLLSNRTSEDEKPRSYVHTPRKSSGNDTPVSRRQSAVVTGRGDDEEDVSQPVLAERGSPLKRDMPPPQSARGSPEKQDLGMATPTPKRRLDAEPPDLPSMTAEEHDLFGHSPSTKRRLNFGTPKSQTLVDASIYSTGATPWLNELNLSTPTTSRTTYDVGSTPSATPSATPQKSIAQKLPESNDYELTAEIFSLLQTSSLPSSTTSAIREKLNAHCLRVSGIEKGRDMSRQALKSKNAKIEELEQKVRKLEREREVDKTIIGNLRRDVREQVTGGREKKSHV